MLNLIEGPACRLCRRNILSGIGGNFPREKRPGSKNNFGGSHVRADGDRHALCAPRQERESLPDEKQ
ncbi:MAG TPA: hypothetical protein DCM49_00475 [Lachnospiraceae bacterium]|nr:hypothetical protein [Lachnospiraceae bacterium]